MSVREKGILTKDSVSLLPCFYFVEVSSCCMLLILHASAYLINEYYNIMSV